jgi:hypothetical protein
MSCENTRILEERIASSTERYSDLVTQLAQGGTISGKLYDSLTKEKDRVWNEMQAAQRALDDHRNEHGC